MSILYIFTIFDILSKSKNIIFDIKRELYKFQKCKRVVAEKN